MEDKVNIFEDKIAVTDGEYIYLKRWIPNQLPKKPVIIQIAHGMAEHIGRYDDFARTLAEEGWIVCGNDHRGHGKTAKSVDDLGYFADANGWNRVVKDLNEVTMRVKKDYPNSTVILVGHSMGSFLVRRYVQCFPNDINAMILSGTAYSKGLIGKIGIEIAKWGKKRKGKKTKSEILDKLSFGSFNKKVLPSITPFDWLSKDESIVNSYIEDELCGFIFTWGGFYDLLKGIETIHKKAEIRNTPKDLPIYIFSGEEDPVGSFGIGVKKVHKAYLDIGIKDVTCKLYPKGRHEMLNEINRQQVYKDTIDWIKNRTK